MKIVASKRRKGEHGEQGKRDLTINESALCRTEAMETSAFLWMKVEGLISAYEEAQKERDEAIHCHDEKELKDESLAKDKTADDEIHRLKDALALANTEVATLTTEATTAKDAAKNGSN
ncbi:hypothetical protein NE237_003976 [Protea cynaroides]|uniref:Uncharacterized protein n=1 Tax=Protea cynaroides TaxID=273540 RepID=A0A9Q0KI10_9MAGN|nr:hypothetical protein NE237_003976 [Protea cynaroides]